MIATLRLASRPAVSLRSQTRTRPVLPSTYWLARTVVTKRYTEEHEVISYDDATLIGRLHITEYASKSLGDVVFVELPKKGREVEKGGKFKPEFPLNGPNAYDDKIEQIGAVESVKAASDIYAPISGTVSEINESLGEKPGLMSSDPESAGWLCDLKITKPEELDSLLTPEAYEKFCEDH